jgi:hypothetical protein
MSPENGLGARRVLRATPERYDAVRLYGIAAMLRWPRYLWLSALVGFAAVFSSSIGARQTEPQIPADDPDGAVRLKVENGHFLISERGGPFAVLDLGDTTEASELKRLFERLSPDGAAVRVPTDNRLVADGGVSAYKPSPTKKHDGPKSGRR